METKDNPLLTGNLWKEIFIFSLPLILSNLLQILFNMSDLAVIGQFSGSVSLGAVGSTTILIYLFTAFLIGMGNAVDVIVARFIGSSDEQNTKEAILTSFFVCLLFGVIACLLGVFLSRNILILMKTQEIFLDKATDYLKIYFLGMPGLAIYNFGNAVYSALGETRKPLLFLVIAGVLNILLNLLFVIVFNLDVIGVGLASCISQTLSAVFVTISLLLRKDIIKLNFDFKIFNYQKSLNLIKIGIPSGLQNAMFAIANLFIQSALNTLPAVYVEGNSAASYADSLVWETMAGFYMASSSFISQNYACGNKKRIKYTYFITTIYSAGIAIIFGIMLILFGKQFMSIFTSDKEVINAGYEKIFIMAFSYFTSAFMDNSIASSRGLSKVVWPTIIVIMGSVVFRIAWIYVIFYYFRTIESLYLLYIFSWVLTAIFEVGYFAIIYKKLTKEMKY